MADLDFSLPATGIKYPDPAATLSAVANLNMSQAHSDLYSLQAAMQKQFLQGAAKYQQSGDISDLANAGPQGAEMAKNLLDVESKRRDNMVNSFGAVANGILALPAEQRAQARDDAVDLFVRNKVMSPDEGARAKAVPYSDDRMRQLASQGLKPNEVPSIVGQTALQRSTGEYPAQANLAAGNASREPPVTTQEQTGVDQNGKPTYSNVIRPRTEQPGAIAPPPLGVMPSLGAGAPSAGPAGPGPGAEASAPGGTGIPLKAYATRISARMENPGGNPAQMNKAGSPAMGDGQFMPETWLDVMQSRPDLTQGKTQAQILAMRADAPLSAEMTGQYAKQNAPLLAQAGLPVNAATLALAHQQGPAGAVRILQALQNNPQTPMGAVITDQANLRQNAIPHNMPVSTYLRTFANRMGTEPISDLGSIPPETVSRVALPGPTEPALSAQAGSPAETFAAASAQPTGAGANGFVVPGAPAPAVRTAAAGAAGETAPFQPQVVFGDSIAQQVNNHLKLPGWTKVGANPTTILQQITAADPTTIQGQNVVLSTGLSNAADPAQLKVVAQQLQTLMAPVSQGGKGAAGVTVLGLGTRPDIEPLTEPLRSLAEANGARFAPLPANRLNPDQVHLLNGNDGVAAIRAAPPASPQEASGQPALAAGPAGRPSVQLIPPAEQPAATPAAAVTPGAPAAAAQAADQPALGPGARLGPPIMTEQQKQQAEFAQQARLKALESTESTIADDTKEVYKSASGAETGQQIVPLIRQAFKEFGETGSLAEAKQAYQKWVVALAPYFGYSADETRRMAAAGETIDKQGQALGFELVKALGTREALGVVNRVMAIKPNLQNTTAGNALLLSAIEQEFNRRIVKRDFFDSWVDPSRPDHHADYTGAASAFNKVFPTDVFASRVVPLDPPADRSKLVPNAIYQNGAGHVLMWDGEKFVGPPK